MHPELNAIVPDPDAENGAISGKGRERFSERGHDHARSFPAAARDAERAAERGEALLCQTCPRRARAMPARARGRRRSLKSVHGKPPPPPCRKLRGYVFDPSVSTQLQYVALSETTYSIPWEGAEELKPGPVGEYLEVLDPDETGVDLNSPHLLAQDGLEPSESSPQFRQQMVYAVGMQTISVFEAALGRLSQWAPDQQGELRQNAQAAAAWHSGGQRFLQPAGSCHLLRLLQGDEP